MFNQNPSYNGDISKWDTSGVTSMQSMFNSATSFNQPIENWNTMRVTSMSYMFYYATSFNHYVGGWDTSTLSSYDYIFRYATAFEAKYTCTDSNYYNSVRPSTCSTLRSSWVAPPPPTSF